jgi:tyrosinase
MRGTYDRANWDMSANSFRNKLEGWRDAQTPPRQPPRMHNRIHVFIGGSMAPASSPNDPLFFLNHCNVDRQWEAWLTQRGRTYVPGAGQGPAGHQANDPLFSIVWPAMQPS